MKPFWSISIILRLRIIAIGILVHLFVLSVSSDPVVIPTPTEQAVAYHNLSNFAWGINEVLTLLLPVVFLIFGLGRRFANKLLKYGKYLTFVIFAAIFFFLNWLIQLPLERIRIATRNQLESDPSLPILQWIFDQFLGSLPLIIFSIFAALFVYWLINKSPRKWWLWATGVFSFLFLVFLVIEPLTISHKPLGQTPTEVKISELAEQIGIPKYSVVLENCEPFDRCEIAHVSGLGPTRLILLNQGIFQNYPESWTIQTFAHESKHFVKDDNLTGWLVLTLIFLFCFWLLDRICKKILQRSSFQPGVSSISQPAALPLMILVLNIMFLIALPPINKFRQHVEFEADRYGLELTHENRVLAEMVSSWTTRSKLRMPDPSLFFMLFRSSHPSDATRISFANEYQLKDKKE